MTLILGLLISNQVCSIFQCKKIAYYSRLQYKYGFSKLNEMKITKKKKKIQCRNKEYKEKTIIAPQFALSVFLH